MKKIVILSILSVVSGQVVIGREASGVRKEKIDELYRTNKILEGIDKQLKTTHEVLAKKLKDAYKQAAPADKSSLKAAITNFADRNYITVNLDS